MNCIARFLTATSFIAATLFFTVNANAASGDVDTTFNAAAYGSFNGTVSVMRKQPDGKILVGGSFTEISGVAAPGVGRLNSDGGVDMTFNPPMFGNNFGIGGNIFAIAVQSDGKIIVGGDISQTDGVYTAVIRRLMPDGSLDPTFQSPTFDLPPTIYDIEVLADDKVLVGGSMSINSNTRTLIRLNADGALDNSFSASMPVIREIEVQTNGTIFAGSRVADGGASLFKLNADGSPAAGFSTLITDGTIEVIRPVNDGFVIIGGGFQKINGFQVGGIARVNPDGTLDPSFNQNNTGANGSVNEIVVLSDGRLLLGGAFGSFNTILRRKIARLNSDGSLDTALEDNPLLVDSTANDMEILQNGQLLAGFSFAISIHSLQKINPDGTLDAAYSTPVTQGGRVWKVLPQPDGKVLICGQFKYVNGVARNSLARLNADGSLDTSFIPYFNNHIAQHLTAIAFQTDNKIIVGGLAGPGLRRLNADGTEDTAFSTAISSSSSIYDTAVLPNGQIIVAGDLGVAGNGRKIVRLNNDGSTDNTFGTIQPNLTVFQVIPLSNDRIMIGGEFTQIGSALRGRVARLNADGSLDTTFNPPGGANGTVYKMNIQSDGRIVLGGEFTALNGSTARQRIGRLNADGSLDISFANSINGGVVGIEIQSDGKILIGGVFSTVGLTERIGIARLNSNGTLDASFNVNAPVGVLDIVLQPDNRILVGGAFFKLNGQSRVRVARLTNTVLPSRTLYDFDGDGRADVSVFRPSTGRWYELRSSDLQVEEMTFGAAGDIPVPADFDGDGKTDEAIFRPSTGTWWYQNSITGTHNAVQFGQADDVPRPSDFDGDGRADFIVYRPSNSVWYRLGTSGELSIMQFGIAEDKPLIGDFDGDGKSDVAIYRPSTGTWWYAASGSPGQFRAVQFGISTDIPAAADFDGDGRTDFAVYRPSEGGWYVLNSSNGSVTTTAFGIAEDRPVPADYDGDGRADVAVFRPSTGVWYLLRSTSGFGAVQFGVGTDVAMPNALVP